MERSASAHLETDQGARLPWLRLLAPAGKSYVVVLLICRPIFCRFVFLTNASCVTVVLAVPLNLAGLNVYRELFEPILKDKNMEKHHFPIWTPVTL
jgi:hypothetical protein